MNEHKGLTRDVVLWTGAAWWRDCDPFVRVVGATREAVADQLDAATREAAEEVLNSDDGPCPWCGAEPDESADDLSAWLAEHRDCADICETMGAESYRGMVREAKKAGWWSETGRRELCGIREGLREDGYAFLAD